MSRPATIASTTTSARILSPTLTLLLTPNEPTLESDRPAWLTVAPSLNTGRGRPRHSHYRSGGSIPLGQQGSAPGRQGLVVANPGAHDQVGGCRGYWTLDEVRNATCWPLGPCGLDFCPVRTVAIHSTLSKTYSTYTSSLHRGEWTNDQLAEYLSSHLGEIRASRHGGGIRDHGEPHRDCGCWSRSRSWRFRSWLVRCANLQVAPGRTRSLIGVCPPLDRRPVAARSPKEYFGG